MRGRSVLVRIFFALFAFVGLNASGQTAGEPPPIIRPSGTILRNVERVIIPVNVVDPFNRYVTGLGKENFVLSVDGDKKKIEKVSQGDVPVVIGIIWDTSGSMSDKREKAKEAIQKFIAASNPKDTFCLIDFNEEKPVASDFMDGDELIGHFDLLFKANKGRTPLLDAVYFGLARLKAKRDNDKSGILSEDAIARYALIIVSDGGENMSRYTKSEVEGFIEEADIQIYAIGVFGQVRTIEEFTGPNLLAELSEMTGGRCLQSVNEDCRAEIRSMYPFEDPQILEKIANEIGVELRNQYLLLYNPNARDNKSEKKGRCKSKSCWHNIKVEIKPPKGLPPLKAKFRKGYYSPEDR